MKKLLLIAALGIASLVTAPAKAQVRLSVNLGIQPAWGLRGYDHVDYYYLPDVDSYYDVPTREYVYFEGGSWVHRRYLPARYRNYDLYGGRKVVINSSNPWLRHDVYHTRYVTNYRGAGYRGGVYRGGRGVINRGPVRGGFDHGPRGGGFHGNPGGGFNHGNGGFHGNPGGGNNHGGPGRGNGGNHGGGGGGNHGNGGNHGGGGDNHGGGHRG
ncbi:MAG TPA: hypothetical protein VGC08_10185 [Pedobacter sp.]